MNRKVLLAWMLGLLSIVSTSWAMADDAEKQILALEQKWADAQMANDPDAEAVLFHDNLVFVEPNGSLTSKAEFLANEKNYKYELVELSETKVSVYGDAAVAIYKLRIKGTSSGKPIDLIGRESDTWIKMSSGEWKLVASHSSRIED